MGGKAEILGGQGLAVHIRSSSLFNLFLDLFLVIILFFHYGGAFRRDGVGSGGVDGLAV